MAEPAFSECYKYSREETYRMDEQTGFHKNEDTKMRIIGWDLIK